MRIASAVMMSAMACLAATAFADNPHAEPPASRTDGSRKAIHATEADHLYKSPIQMVVSRDGERLYVVCENSDELLAVDTSDHAVVGAVTVGRHPFGVTLSPGGDRLYVSNRWENTVSVVDPAVMRVLHTFPVGDNPHGLAVDRSGAHVYVANLATDDVSVIETAGHTEVKRLQAGTSPFAIALSPDGRVAYVSNQLSNPVPFRTAPVLELTVIDTERQLVVERRELVSTVVGQEVAVSRDGRFAIVALEMPKNLIPETQIYQGWMVTHGFAVVETRAGGRAAYLLIDEPNLYYPDAFGVAFSPDGRHFYLSSSGADVVSVIDMDRVCAILGVAEGTIGVTDGEIRLLARHLAVSSEYVVARIPTESNPKDLVVSPDGRRVYVANRLADCVTVIDTERLEAVGTIDLGGPKVLTQLRWGERLFNYASISFQRQLSCNTCHPENHLDGLVYDIAIDGGMGRNLVDNRTMQGIAETAPFKWSGKNPTLYRQEGPRAAQLFFRSHGFEPDENEAIVRFIESVPFRPNRYLSPGEPLDESQERGKQLYERAYTNDGRYIPVSNRCITCHPPPFYTDRMTHDVGSQAPFDTHGEFDTPQLNNIYANAPFLHDGRCYSLEEIWTRHNPDDLHGVTNDMKKEQLNDLIEYLKALPPQVPLEDAEPDGMERSEMVAALGMASGNPSAPGSPRYVGNRVCRSCHAGAYRIWVASKHARAYVALQTRMAMMMAEACDADPDCGPSAAKCPMCHATAAGMPERSRAEGFRIEEGVKCEACHGPGEAYCSEEVMRDRDAATAAGLRIPTEQDCRACHDEKPGHDALGRKPFDHATAWKAIAHPKEAR